MVLQELDSMGRQMSVQKRLSEHDKAVHDKRCPLNFPDRIKHSTLNSGKYIDTFSLQD